MQFIVMTAKETSKCSCKLVVIVLNRMRIKEKECSKSLKKQTHVLCYNSCTYVLPRLALIPDAAAYCYFHQ